MTRPFSRRRDGLSLSEALPDRSLFALVAMMGFLAALTVAGASGARALSARWAGGAAQLLTIQVPDADNPVATQDGSTPTTTRVQAVLSDLTSLPAGAEVHQLTQPELARLLEPWLGETDNSALPLPAIIRVKLPPDAAIPTSLEQTLNTHVPGTIMEHNARWGERLRALANSLLACAGLALLTVGGIATMITGLATRTGLASRKEIIKTLHGLGASDSYIAGRFAWRTATLGFGGGLTGTLGACLPLLLLLQMAAPFASAPRTTPDRLLPQDWHALAGSIPSDMLVALLLLPVGAAFICWLTTQIMVRLWLLRLP